MADYMALRARPASPRACWRCCSRPSAIPMRLPAPSSSGRRTLDIPVIALKVGRTEGSKAMVTAHSGALAGEHGAYEARVRRLRRARGAHARRDGRHDGAVLVPAARDGGARHRERARLRRRAGAVRRSRARSRRAVRGDLATRRSRAIDDTLDPGLEAANPLDAWGTGHRRRRDLPRVVPGAARRPRHRGAWRSSVDLTRQGEPYDEGYLQVGARRLGGDHEAVLRRCRTWPAPSRTRRPRTCATRGSPCWRARRRGCVALRAPARRPRRAGRVRSRRLPRPCADEVRARWRARLAAGEEFGELEGLTCSRDYGVPVDRRLGRRRSPTRRSRAAEAIGYPVALKTAAARVCAQVRRGRRACSVWSRPTACAPRTTTSPAGSGPQVAVGGDGAGRRRGRARHRPRPDVRPARARRGRRRPRGAAPRPGARVAAARRAGGPRLSTGCGSARCSTACAGAAPGDVDSLAARGRRACPCSRPTSAICSMRLDVNP